MSPEGEVPPEIREIMDQGFVFGAQSARAEALTTLPSLEKALELEPLVEHPNLFDPEHILTRGDLENYPQLLQRYDRIRDVFEPRTRAKYASQIIVASPEETDYPRQEAIIETLVSDYLKDQFNPFRVNKLGNIVIPSLKIIQSGFDGEAMAKLGEERYDQTVARINSLHRTLVEKKRHQTDEEITDIVTPDLAREVFSIGNLARKIARDATEEKN